MDAAELLAQILFWLALVTLLGTVALAIEFALGNRSLKFLKDIAPLRGPEAPRVSVVIAARNEQRNIEEALRSVLAQDYPHLEVIVVDDRSTDDTGKILDRMAAANSKLRVVHVTELPAGWLGKNHALYCGAQRATGEFLLFADADVVMEPTALTRAMNHVIENRPDHLAVAPRLRMRGAWLNAFGGAFTIFFGLFAKPWKVSDPKSRRHVGIGAFNLMRAEAYRVAGTHRAIAMRPDDDMKLGKLIKKRGLRQELLLGDGMLSVEWYSSVRELIAGLMKNAFAGVDYNVTVIIAGTLFQLVFFVWPFLGIFLTSGVTQLMNLATALALLALYWDNARFHGQNPICGLGFPAVALLFVYILWKSMLTTLVNGGINWRGTHYSLAELRANKI